MWEERNPEGPHPRAGGECWEGTRCLVCQPLPQVHTSGRQKGLSLVPSNGCGRPSPEKSLRSEQEVSL